MQKVLRRTVSEQLEDRMCKRTVAFGLGPSRHIEEKVVYTFAFHFVYGFLSFQINVLMQSYTFLQAISSLLHMRLLFIFYFSFFFYKRLAFSETSFEEMEKNLFQASLIFFFLHHRIIIMVKKNVSFWSKCRWAHFQVVQCLQFMVTIANP